MDRSRLRCHSALQPASPIASAKGATLPSRRPSRSGMRIRFTTAKARLFRTRRDIAQRGDTTPDRSMLGNRPLVAQHLHGQRPIAPQSVVSADRIDIVPLCELFPVERDQGLVAERLAVLDIEAEPDFD